MSWIDGWRERLRPLLDRVGLQGELDEELDFHFEREVEANVASGMSPRRARREARKSMGGALRPAEAVRAQWTGIEFGGLGQELRLALRRLRRRPGFTLVAASTLALGIGANTVIFSLVRGVIVRPLPYEEPGRLALIWNPDRDVVTWLSAREHLEYRDALSSFERQAAYTDFEVALTEDAEPERVRAAAVTASALSVLGVRPHRGRLFGPEDDLPGAAPVTVLSHELWQRRYGGDAAILGRSITAGGRRYVVIGVLPPDFRLPLDFRLEQPTRLFVPAAIDETAELAWGNRSWHIFGRLSPGSSHETATAEIRATALGWVEAGFLDMDDGAHLLRAVPFGELLLSDLRTPLFLLLGAVGLILLIACANVGHLLLARSEARRPEVAVAAALGASRTRLAREQLVESGVLAALGGALGALLAVAGLRAAVALSPVTLIRTRGVELDLWVLAFAALLTVGTTLLAGLAPALRLSGVPLVEAFGGGRGAARRSTRAARRWLVAGESALAVVLVIGAALLARSFAGLSRIELGFESEGVLAAGITLPEPAYPDAERAGAFFRDLGERVARLPGVEAAGAARSVPLAESIGSWTVTLEPPRDPEEYVEPDWQIVTPGYFAAMRLELLEGRFLDARDRAGAPLAAVISETMALRYWPGESAVGKRFHLGTLDQPWIEIVGVASSVRHNELLEAPRLEMYLPHEQWPEMQGGGPPRRTMSLLIRTAGEPTAVLPAVRRVLSEIDPSVPLADPRPMSAVTAGALAEERFATVLFGLFAVLALVLAAVGLYGVTAYSTNERSGELGIRLALGAGRLEVAGLVLREALGIAGLGVLAGSLAAGGLTRLLSSELYGVSPLDPMTFAAVPLLLLAVATLAAWLPARRATSIDPALALRSDG